MIKLSENAINQRAPYKVEQTGDTTFMFENHPLHNQVISSFHDFIVEHNKA